MNEAVTIEHAPQTATPMTAWRPPAAIEATPMAMLARAVENGASIEIIERMMGLSERWEANRARKAFDAAIAEAKAEIPPIIKNKIVDFTGKTGIRTIATRKRRRRRRPLSRRPRRGKPLTRA